MYAWIKYVGKDIELTEKEEISNAEKVGLPKPESHRILKSEHNYTRRGKIIPHTETKVDLYKYFNIPVGDKQFLNNFINSLKKDKKIQIRLHKGA